MSRTKLRREAERLHKRVPRPSGLIVELKEIALRRGRARRFLQMEVNTMTNDTKHTPGPWRTHFIETNKRLHLGYWAFSCADGPVYFKDCREETRVPAANAALIASAPDLLAENARLKEALNSVRRLAEDAQWILATVRERNGHGKIHKSLTKKLPPKETRIPCPTCDGSGLVAPDNATETSCPECFEEIPENED